MIRIIKKHLKKVISLINSKKRDAEFFDIPSVWIKRILNNDNAFIVQVGSNDGISGDPLYDLIHQNKNWEALFIEPVPYLFEKLIKNYKNQSRFIFENVAINDGSIQTFYSVNNSVKSRIPSLPIWFDQLASFKRENITNHLNGVLEPYIEETLINGATLPSLLHKYKIETIDLLHIDVEGYDWVVLSQLDLINFTPDIILYEHKHLSSDEKNQSLNFLKDYNYTVYKLGSDFIGIRNNSTNAKHIRKLKGVKVI
jgi:FkbM family methyltransferase